MNSTEAFTRAALYQSCAKSEILQHIDISQADSDTLRDLVNKYSLLNSRKLPIIISKLMTKKLLELAVHKFPNLNNFMTPQNIRVDVEDDELAYLMNTSSSFKPNIMVLVCKNVAVGVLGSSIDAFKNDLLARSSSNVSVSSVDASLPKITIKSNKMNIQNASIPQKYTDTFVRKEPDLKNISKEQVAQQRKLSRQEANDNNRLTYDTNQSTTDHDNSETTENITISEKVDIAHKLETESDSDLAQELHSNKEIGNFTEENVEIANISEHPKPTILQNEMLPNLSGSTMNSIIYNKDEIITEKSKDDLLTSENTNNEVYANDSHDKISENIDLYNKDIDLDENEYFNDDDDDDNPSDDDDVNSQFSSENIDLQEKKMFKVSDLKPATMKANAENFMDLILAQAPHILEKEYSNKKSRKTHSSIKITEIDDDDVIIINDEKKQRERSTSITSTTIEPVYNDNFTIDDDGEF